MDWSQLFSMQKQLDTYIEQNHNLEQTDLFHEKYVALLVEIGELANETRCFKFWSTKPRSEREAILEEYVDGIHFILSLGIEKGFTYENVERKPVQRTETEQFIHVFRACVTYNDEPNQQNYERLFTNYLMLGDLLGIGEEELQQAYIKKNEINYKRQNEGY
ncbi:MAG TPA: dUTP diphosphatase [Bacillota bacterium]|nr:dUTP diphosphatase [Bacillota bacterium]